MPRDYRREYLMEKPERRKKRAQRNKARRWAIADGKVKKGDKTKDIDHVKDMRYGGKTTKGNIRVRSAKANRADNGGSGGRPKGGKKSLPTWSRSVRKR